MTLAGVRNTDTAVPSSPRPGPYTGFYYRVEVSRWSLAN